MEDESIVDYCKLNGWFWNDGEFIGSDDIIGKGVSFLTLHWVGWDDVKNPLLLKYFFLLASLTSYIECP